MRKKVIFVAGARPNFMKIAPIMREFKKYSKDFHSLLVHTGQHYDFAMSDIFFKDLDIPKPDIHLDVRSASHAVQTARIMDAFEKVCIKEKPQWVIVVGDVNSTLACSLVAAKMGIKVAHVEAGLRSFDRTMPEEINRLVTDSISDILFVSEASGLKNLQREGIPKEKVFFVGNVMIDTLLINKKKCNSRPKTIDNRLKTKDYRPKTNDNHPGSIVNGPWSMVDNKYAVLTLHRPSNVDSKKSLKEIYQILKSVTQSIGVIYPMHPRTGKMLKKHGFLKKFKALDSFVMTDPLGYIDFIRLVKESTFVLTDSGGIQEETTVLKVPCLTMRENTERPVTIKQGNNVLVGRNQNLIKRCVKNILQGKVKSPNRPRYWDGRTSERIAKILKKYKV